MGGFAGRHSDAEWEASLSISKIGRSRYSDIIGEESVLLWFHLVDSLVVDNDLNIFLEVFVDSDFHPDFFARNVAFFAVDIHFAGDRFSFHESWLVECYPDLCLHRN